MSDDEDVEQFETADSGASTTYPMQAGNVRKGGFMVIKGRPTKVWSCDLASALSAIHSTIVSFKENAIIFHPHFSVGLDSNFCGRIHFLGFSTIEERFSFKLIKKRVSTSGYRRHHVEDR